MIYLAGAVGCSALVAILMRWSAGKVQGGMAMLAVSYAVCLLPALHDAEGVIVPDGPGLGLALGLGAAQGALYLLGFVLMRRSMIRCGVVLPAIFMKLGLVVPLAVSVGFLGERPGWGQILGLLVALGAIVLLHLQKGGSGGVLGPELLLLLLASGGGDTMSKLFQQLGNAALSPQFLLYVFAAATALAVVGAVKEGKRLEGNQIWMGCLLGLPNYFCSKFLLRSLQDLPAFVVYPTFSVAALLVVSLAGILLFRERLTPRQWTAAGLLIAALALLNG